MNNDDQAPGSDSNQPASLTATQKALVALEKVKAKLDFVERRRLEPIAIIGLACRFPGDADTPEKFFGLLEVGKDAVSRVPEDRWLIAEGPADEDSAMQ